MSGVADPAAADEQQLLADADAERLGAADGDEEGDPYEDDDDEDDDDVVFQTLDDRPVMVHKGLYIGSFMAEHNRDAMLTAGITHVIQVAGGFEPSHPEHFRYLGLPVQDLPTQDLVAHFGRCFTFIDEAIDKGGGALVHCAAGVSRSASVVIGYIMWKRQLGYEEAFRMLHAVRPWVMPNAGFKQQLLEFERIGCDVEQWRGWQGRFNDELSWFKRKDCSSGSCF